MIQYTKDNKKSTPIFKTDKNVYDECVNVKQLLLEYFLAWEKEEGEIKTWKEFAEHCGFDHIYLNKIYNGKRKAGEKTIQQLANYFRDPRYYDAAGMDRPEPMTSYIRRNLGMAPDEVKKKIAEELSQYSSEPLPTDEGGSNGKQISERLC